ncbi:galactose mutarotase [Olivibacter sp. SDN3]|uniref:aldose epimerase family protein n=1 Tax=Olivibacter sp. SDN3 TaxID=2764720 RepID=UPI0016519FBC|nr:aldose epimerase family protein [Olivibacter sp. SDN3]QNL49562.1 galactose mutarotase [Olivibacter sp. SDN3]
MSKVKQYLLSNKNGMRVGISNLGAVITCISVADRNGSFSNVVLSYPDLDSYGNDKHYIGATLGRYANRIKNGLFSLYDQQIQVTVNESKGHHHLHGGFSGFSNKIWTTAAHSNQNIVLHYVSPSEEEGFPGELSVNISYTLKDDDTLWITYQATTNAATIVNLSNHSYFNLAARGTIDDHFLQIHAAQYTPTDDHFIPTGEIASVEGTLFDLRRTTLMKEVMKEMVTANYAFGPQRELRLMATVKEQTSGRQLEVCGTQPGMQVYFGNFLDDAFKPFQGICLEPQHYPDAPNHSAFPSTVLNPSELYEQQISYRFTNF